MVVINPTDLEGELTRLVKGDQAVDWSKKDKRDVAKEEVS